MEIVFKRYAQRGIAKLIRYIHDELKMPETAIGFNERIQHFVFDELPAQVKIHQLCAKESWAKKELRCVVFEKKYVIAYKVVDEKLNIYNFIHGGKITESKY